VLDIVIVGAGGCGREVYLWAKSSLDKSKYMVKGFISDNSSDLDNFDIDVGIIGDNETYKVEENDRFLFAIGNIDTKKRIVKTLKDRGAKFLTLIHKTAIVADSAKIGEGVIVCPFAMVSDSVVLGDFVVLNFYSSCAHDSKVGKYSVLSPYATINGFAVLEDEVFLGTRSTVVPYKKVGYRAKISANSVAMNNVPAHTLIRGVPGKKVNRIFRLLRKKVRAAQAKKVRATQAKISPNPLFKKL